MKIRFIYPRGTEIPLQYRKRMSTLNFVTLAGLTPPEYEIELIDERLEEIDFFDDVDLVGISAMTYQISRAYEIASIYRQKGIKVVLGGPHPSLLPEEAEEFADAVVIGEGESTWLQVLQDFESQRLQKIYGCSLKPDLAGMPHPRRELLISKPYLPVYPIQASRGCPLNCDFCSVPDSFGRSFRTRPVDEVIDEIKELKGYPYFVDDAIGINKSYARKLLEALIPLKIKWTFNGSMHLSGDLPFLKLIADSGCWLVYLDLGGPWLSAELGNTVESVSYRNKLFKFINTLRDLGIKVIGSFVFGFDHDDEGVFERTVDFAKGMNLEEAEFLILTPYPKTRLNERLSSEGRIFERDWGKYTTTNVVFKPKLMTPEKLQEGFIQAWKEFYPPEKVIYSNEGISVITDSAFPT